MEDAEGSELDTENSIALEELSVGVGVDGAGESFVRVR